MPTFGTVIHAIAAVLDFALTIYMWIIIARAVISWLNADPHNPIVKILTRATEPVLRPIRNKLMPITGEDFSPVIVVVSIILLQHLVL